MLIKKLIALCKQRKILNVYNDSSVQYISDDRCFYPIFKDFEFNSTSLCQIYDINKDKMFLSDHAELPSGISGKDSMDGEKECEVLPIQLFFQNGLYLALKSDNGIAFIKKDLLSPLSDEEQTDIAIYERKLGETSFYYAVKIGLLLRAIVLPTQILTDDSLSNIKNFAQLCEKTHSHNPKT